MDEYNPTVMEKKRMVLDALSLYPHPLTNKMRASIARANPHGTRGKEIIEKMYERMDSIINTAVAIAEPHIIHHAVAELAPHRFHDGHTLVLALDDKPLSNHKEHIEQMFRKAASLQTLMESGTAAASNLVENLLDYHLRARSDPVLAERVPKLRELVETIPARDLAPLLHHVLKGNLTVLGPHTIIDAIADEKDPSKRIGKVKFLLKVARQLDDHPNGVNALEQKVKRKIDTVTLKDLIIYGLDSTAARRDAMRALNRRYNR